MSVRVRVHVCVSVTLSVCMCVCQLLSSETVFFALLPFPSWWPHNGLVLDMVDAQVTPGVGRYWQYCVKEIYPQTY